MRIFDDDRNGGGFCRQAVSRSGRRDVILRFRWTFEDIAVERSRDSITQLLDIRPEYANLVTKDGTVTKVSPTQVELDEVIKIKPGERVPLDGKVIQGSAYLDTAALTGNQNRA